MYDYVASKLNSMKKMKTWTLKSECLMPAHFFPDRISLDVGRQTIPYRLSPIQLYNSFQSRQTETASKQRSNFSASLISKMVLTYSIETLDGHWVSTNISHDWSGHSDNQLNLCYPCKIMQKVLISLHRHNVLIKGVHFVSWRSDCCSRSSWWASALCWHWAAVVPYDQSPRDPSRCSLLLLYCGLWALRRLWW